MIKEETYKARWIDGVYQESRSVETICNKAGEQRPRVVTIGGM